MVFDEFLVKDTVVGLRKLGQWPLSEEVVIEEPLWEYFAHYLVHVYKCSKGSKNDGDRAAASTILTYFSIMMNKASALYSKTGTDKAKLFFACTDSGSSSAVADWYRGVKHNVKAICYDLGTDEGRSDDHSAVPIWPVQIRKVNKKYALCGGLDAAQRKLTLTVALFSAGRRRQRPRQ